MHSAVSFPLVLGQKGGTSTTPARGMYLHDNRRMCFQRVAWQGNARAAGRSGGAGCGKPEFFIKRKPLFEVHTETGMLMNTDGGTPMVPIGEEDLPAPAYASSAPSIGAGGGNATGRARVFQGGFFQDLHNMLDVSTGGEVSDCNTVMSLGGSHSP